MKKDAVYLTNSSLQCMSWLQSVFCLFNLGIDKKEIQQIIVSIIQIWNSREVSALLESDDCFSQLILTCYGLCMVSWRPRCQILVSLMRESSLPAAVETYVAFQRERNKKERRIKGCNT